MDDKKKLLINFEYLNSKYKSLKFLYERDKEKMIFLNNKFSQANSNFLIQNYEISKLKSQLELHQEL
jgi:hypothetical protein